MPAAPLFSLVIARSAFWAEKVLSFPPLRVRAAVFLRRASPVAGEVSAVADDPVARNYNGNRVVADRLHGGRIVAQTLPHQAKSRRAPFCARNGFESGGGRESAAGFAAPVCAWFWF